MADLDPRFAAYEVPAEWPNPRPPLIFGERFQRIIRMSGFDHTDSTLYWQSIPPGEPWPVDEIKNFWLQSLQIGRLPETGQSVP